MRSRSCSALVACAVLAAAAPALAEDRSAQCAADSEEAQSLRDKNQYRAARTKLRSCSQSTCPGVVRKDCTKWLAELEDALPTLVVAAVDEKGVDLVDVELTLDGETLATRLDGTPILVDPGSHELRATAAGRPPVKTPIVVRVGDKNRIFRVTMPSAGAPLEPAGTAPATEGSTTTGPRGAAKPSHAPPVSSIVLGSVGVAALASWAIFGLTAQSDFNGLKNECGPHCEGSTGGIKTRMAVADISLVVGVASLGTAAVLWILHKPAAPKQAQLHFGAAPVAGGAAASLGGSF